MPATGLKLCAYSLLAMLIFQACSESKPDDNTSPAPVYSHPKITNLDTLKGYAVNSITKDSILPLISESGDVVITGRPTQIKGVIIDDNVARNSKMVKAKSPDIVALNKNVVQVGTPERVKAIPDYPVKDSVDSYLINSIGDIIRSGTPLSVQGKPVFKTEPVPTLAHLPKFKDVATEDFQYLDVDQGIISSYIYEVYIDSRNNIWFGTYEGLSKFNGSSFINYTVKEGLSGNQIWAITEDRNGNMWFGSNGGGVSMFDGDKFVHFTEEEGLSRNEVWDILEDSKGNMWFATLGGGVSKYDGVHFTHYTQKEGLSHNEIWSILEDKKGNLWFGTYGGGVSKYDGESFIHYDKESGLGGNRVWTMMEDYRGDIWFGTYGDGVTRYDGEYFYNYSKEEGLTSDIILSIYEDDDHNIWFGTYGEGVDRFDGKNIINYAQEEGVSHGDVMSVIEDDYGNIWLGTNGGGVTRFNKQSFSHFGAREGLSDDVVLSIEEDNSGNVWIGSNGGGVSMYDGKTFSNYKTEQGLNGNVIWSVLNDSKGNLWFGTRNNGLSKFNGESFIHFSHYQNLLSQVPALFEDSKGNIWMGTEGAGIMKYDGKSIINYNSENGLGSNQIWSVLEDKKGNIWFGTVGGGIVKFDGELFTSYTEKEGLGSNAVWSMCESSDGGIWIGTDEGVSKFDGQNFLHFTKESGLCSNIIWSIIEDHNNNIWLGTQNGISVLKTLDAKNNDGDKPLTIIKTYDRLDGLKGLDFYENSVLIDRNKKIWLGSGKGVSRFDLEKFSINETPPVVRLNSIEIKEQFIDFKNINDSLWSDIVFDSVRPYTNLPVDLVLPFDKNHITFYFSAIDWSAPQKVKYSYKIEGLNDEWSEPSRDIKADFRSIPYGSYTFKVCAVKESGNWSEPFSYDFTIEPPIWKTWWAIVGYFVLFFLLVIGVFKWRTTRLKKHKEYLRIEVKKATREIRRQKEELKRTLISNEEKEILLKEIHHRVKNNLQIINSLIRLQSDFMNASNFREKLKETEDRIQSMRLIHEMLYKSEDFTNLNIKDYIHELKENIIGAHNNNQIDIIFKMEVEALELGMDLLISLGLIINEIFSNSLKHAFQDRPEGNISLKLFSDSSKIYIKIDDDGIGSDIPAEILCDNSLGMDLIWSLADQLDAEINVDTVNGFHYELVLPY